MSYNCNKRLAEGGETNELGIQKDPAAAAAHPAAQETRPEVETKGDPYCFFFLKQRGNMKKDF